MFKKISKLLSHTLIYGLGNSGNRLIGFFLLPVYSRYLTPEDYGVLALVGMLGQVLFTLMSVGQNSAFFRTYLLYEDPEQREAVLATALWIILTLSFPIGLVALMLSKPLALLLTGGPGYTEWVLIGIGGVIFRLLLRMPMQVFRAREESRRYAVSSFVRTLIGLALAVIFVVGLHLGGRGVLLSQLLAELLLCLYLVPVTVRGLKLKFSGRDARDMLGYGIYLVPAGLLSFLIHLSDRFFLKQFVSLNAVGLYALGYRFGEILSFPMQAFGLSWPQFLFGNRKSEQAPALYARVFTYYLMVLAFLWLGVSLLAEDVITLMMHPSFHDSYRVVPWIAGSFLCQGLAFVGDVGIKLSRKVKYRPVILAAAGVLSVVLNLTLIPRYGMMGAAVANLACFAFQGMLRILVGNIFYPLPYEYKRISRVALITVVLYSIGGGVAWDGVWTALASKAVLLLCYPLLLYVSGFFQASEIERLRELLVNLRQRSGKFVQSQGVDG